MPNSSGFNRTIKVGVGSVDVLLYHLSFILTFLIRYNGERPVFNYSAYLSALPYVLLVFVLINTFSGIYTLYNKRYIDIFSTTLISQIMMTVILTAMTFYGRWFAFPRTIILLSLLISTIVLSLWRMMVLKIYIKNSGVSRVMILGDKIDSAAAVMNFKSSKSRQYKITTVVTGHFMEHIKNNIDNIEVFYVLGFKSLSQQNEVLSYLTLMNKRIFLDTTFENILKVNNRIMNIDDESLIAISKFEISPENDTVKRMFDFVAALIMLIVFSPVMLFTALAIKLTSKGPVLYKQVRITKGHKEFNIYKFRSMRIDAEEGSGPVFAQAEDPRVTKLGKYLRSLRIDELPQLINVLKGDMSLIGPRPERPFFVEQFQEQNPYYYLRHNVRAGITGYAQVYGTYATSFTHKLRFDLLYIKNYSLLLDIQILFQTVKILFDKASSQGIKEEMTMEEIFKDVSIYE